PPPPPPPPPPFLPPHPPKPDLVRSLVGSDMFIRDRYYVMPTAVVIIFALMTLRKDDHLRFLEELYCCRVALRLAGIGYHGFVGGVRRSRHPAQQATRADA
ncbi:hypothetical protein ACVGWQ_04025, partial [Enterobacter hormaechei]